MFLDLSVAVFLQVTLYVRSLLLQSLSCLHNWFANTAQEDINKVVLHRKNS